VQLALDELGESWEVDGGVQLVWVEQGSVDMQVEEEVEQHCVHELACVQLLVVVLVDLYEALG